MAVTVAALLVVVVALVVRRLLSYMHFRRLELAIPGPPSLPVLGNVLSMVGITEDTVLSRVLALWDNRHSELRRLSIFGHLVVFVSSPDHVQEVFVRNDLVDKDRIMYRFFREGLGDGLISQNGKKWRTHRRALQPAFHHSVLDRYTSVFSAEALGFVSRVRPGVEQDVEDNLRSLVTRSFLWTAVASNKGEEEVERALPLLKAFLHSVGHSFGYRCMQPWLWPSLTFGLTGAGRSIRQLKEKIHAFVTDITCVRREELKKSGVQCYDDGDLASRRRTLLDILLEPSDHLALSDEEILDEIVVFMSAAIDTTVTTLGWVLKTLSLRQDIQARLLQEAEEVLGTDPSVEITTGDLMKLEYTERVLKETMRLLPAVPFIAREVRQQTDLCGHTLPAGTTLLVNILGAQRDPRHWPDPLRFDPDRFLPERSQGRHPYAYLPFSAGTRNCIGSRYAMMSMKRLLATLVPRYRIDPVDDGITEPADYPITVGAVTRMVGGVRVVFTPRADCAA